MKLVSFLSGQRASYGLLRGTEIVDLGAHGLAPSLQALLALDGWQAQVRACMDHPRNFQLSDVQLLPPVPTPHAIICVGHNYEGHRVETQRDPTAHPSIFFRYPESLRASGATLVRPRESVQFDYEGELAVVIGRGGRRIAPQSAWAHVAGVSCFNDGSIRDWQHHTRQFGPGKNFAATAGFGPALVTLDELPTDQALELWTRVNGHVVQHAHTDQLIFPIPQIIAYVSTFMTLHPGDVIATGTPGGVGAKRTPPLWLAPGDHVAVEISCVGVLTNQVQQEN